MARVTSQALARSIALRVSGKTPLWSETVWSEGGPTPTVEQIVNSGLIAAAHYAINAQMAAPTPIRDHHSATEVLTGIHPVRAEAAVQIAYKRSEHWRLLPAYLALRNGYSLSPHREAVALTAGPASTESWFPSPIALRPGNPTFADPPPETLVPTTFQRAVVGFAAEVVPATVERLHGHGIGITPAGLWAGSVGSLLAHHFYEFADAIPPPTPRRDGPIAAERSAKLRHAAAVGAAGAKQAHSWYAQIADLEVAAGLRVQDMVTLQSVCALEETDATEHVGGVMAMRNPCCLAIVGPREGKDGRCSTCSQGLSQNPKSARMVPMIERLAARGLQFCPH